MTTFDIALTSREDHTSFTVAVTAQNKEEARAEVRELYPYCRIDSINRAGERERRAYFAALNEEY